MRVPRRLKTIDRLERATRQRRPSIVATPLALPTLGVSGTTSATWAGGTASAVKAVKHGLGVTPGFVGLIIFTGAGGSLFTPRLVAKDEETFEFQFNRNEALTATLEVLWWAVP